MNISTKESRLTLLRNLAVCQGVLPLFASALTSRSLTGVSVFSRQISGFPSDLPSSVCAGIHDYFSQDALVISVLFTVPNCLHPNRPGLCRKSYSIYFTYNSD